MLPGGVRLGEQMLVGLATGRVRLGGRILRVVTLADRVTIHNAFFDRGFRP